MVVEYLPCDCVALGTISAIFGLLLNQLSFGSSTFSNGVTYSILCKYDSATYDYGIIRTFKYSWDADDCVVSDASNNEDVTVPVCDKWTMYAGIAFVCCVIAGTFAVIYGVQSQAPKFALKKKWGFRWGILFSGCFYIGGAYVWYFKSQCTSSQYQDLVRTSANMGLSWYLVALGGILNTFGGMLAFISQEELISEAKKRERTDRNKMHKVNSAEIEQPDFNFLTRKSSVLDSAETLSDFGTNLSTNLSDESFLNT